MFKLFGRLKKEAPASKPIEHQAASVQNVTAPQQPRGTTRPLPEERVLFLISQGLAEPEIIKVLKDEGYSFQEIDSGITNVLKRRVSSEQHFAPSNPFELSHEEDLAPVYHPNQDVVAREEAEQQKKAAMIEEMEEIIETLIEEKLSRVLDELDKAEKKFNEINDKLRQINDRVSAFEAQEKNIEFGESEKIGELKSKEENIEPRIASLEKAFKDIIPNLVDSIREMRETLASSRRREPSADSEANTREEFEEEKSGKSIFD